MVFNDEDLCNKSALFDPLLHALLAKKLKGAVSRNSAKLRNYKMPVKLRET